MDVSTYLQACCSAISALAFLNFSKQDGYRKYRLKISDCEFKNFSIVAQHQVYKHQVVGQVSVKSPVHSQLLLAAAVSACSATVATIKPTFFTGASCCRPIHAGTEYITPILLAMVCWTKTISAQCALMMLIIISSMLEKIRRYASFN